MSGPEKVSAAQLNSYLTRINTGGVPEVIKVYQELQDKGYGYAGWAKGVATAETVTGLAAVDYLTGTALIGLGGEESRNLSKAQIDAIRVGMADGFVRALLAEANRPENNGFVSSDVNFRDTEIFHQRVFERNGLTNNNWTLKIPMELIRLTEGEAAVEAYWVRIRDTGGEGPDAILESMWLYTKIGKLANGSDPAIAAQANDWISRVPGTANFDALTRAADDLYTVLVEQNPWLYLIPTTGPILLAITLLRQPDFDLQLFNADILSDFAFDFLPLWINAKITTSPLILDLDGDWVETQSKTEGIYFDHAGDGFAEATGWAGADDGLLVRDLNGDGLINNGSELFGNNTRLSNGQKAANGFEALKDLDSNKDGKLNSADTAWNSLRVWKDTDADAQTDAGELRSLTEAGVKEIKLAYTNAGTNPDQHGNEHRQLGSYTTTAGTTQTVNDVWFPTDNWNTIDQRTPIALSSTVAALPEVIGSGTLGSLRQAMMRDTTGQLIVAVNTYLNNSNLAQRDSLLQDVLYRWAGVQNQDPAMRGPYLEDGRKLAVLEAFFGEQYEHLGGGDTGPTINDPGPNAANALLELYGKVLTRLGAQLDIHGRDANFYNAISLNWNESTGSFSIDVSGVEAYVRQLYIQQPQQTLDSLRQFIFNLQALDTTEVLNALAATGSLQGDPVDQLLAHANWTWGTTGEDRLTADFSDNSRLFGWDGDDFIYGINGNDILDGGAGNDYLEGGAGADVYLFGKGSGQDIISNSDTDAIGTHADTILLGPSISTTDVILRNEFYDLVISIKGTNDKLRVNSYFFTEGGVSHVVENLKFADGTVWDINTVKIKALEATEGDDELTGFSSADVIQAGGGNDKIYGNDGNDTLDGGTGNDYLDGGEGDDTYLFGKGDGQDTISPDYDTAANKLNVLRFKAGVAPAEILSSRSGYDLVLSIAGTTDKITIRYFFYDNDPSNIHNPIQQVSFADGTVWNLSTIKAMAIAGNDTAQTLTGYDSDDTINALGGNDTVFGLNGNDYINGGTGNDYIDGGEGNDTLDGGAGTDTMVGGAGNDTYVVNVATDVVTELANEGTDTVQSSVTYTLTANVENLTLTGTTAINGTGNALNNTLIGNSANNRLTGGAGNDTLNGGAGNDLLYGGNGNDTFTFNKGDGKDTVYVGETSGSNATETLILGNLNRADINLLKYNNSLYVQQKGSTTDHVKIVNHFNGGAGELDKLIFADGLTWDAATIKANSVQVVQDPDYV
jgi:Ca2+-binding RTX toxin-like protein